MLQNLPSVVAARVMNPQAGWRVMDMCAAPGGKATAIAALMSDQGEVIALDRTHKKVMAQGLRPSDKVGLPSWAGGGILCVSNGIVAGQDFSKAALRC